MTLFSKKPPERHIGSGLDKPDPKSLLQKVTDTIKPVIRREKPAAENSGSR